MASSLKSDWRSNSPNRACSCSNSDLGFAPPFDTGGGFAGCGGSAVAVEVAEGCRAERKVSISGLRFCLTLSTSVLIWVMVDSCVRGCCEEAFLDEDFLGSAMVLSPPPTMARAAFSLIPYADTTCQNQNME